MSNSIVFRVRGQVAGVLVDGHIFRRIVRASKHFLHKPPAIAVDLDSLLLAEDAGADLVEVIDEESGRVYRADVNTLHRWGRPIDRGFGRQLALPLGRWTLSDPAQPLRQGSLLTEVGL